MSEPHDEPLDPAVAALIEADRARPGSGAPAHVRAAVRARVQSTLAAAALPAAPSGSPATPPTGPASTALPSPSGATRTARRLAGWLALFTAGAGAGAAAHARFGAPRERVVYVRQRVEVAVPVAAPVSTAVVPPPPVAPVDAATTPLPPLVGSTTARPGGPRDEPARSDLDAERVLLERARSALVRGRADDALGAVAQHARRFPRGQLGEEFASLGVQALVAARRYDDARAAAARFHQRFGDGLLGPVVDAAIRSIP